MVYLTLSVSVKFLQCTCNSQMWSWASGWTSIIRPFPRTRRISGHALLTSYKYNGDALTLADFLSWLKSHGVVILRTSAAKYVLLGDRGLGRFGGWRKLQCWMSLWCLNPEGLDSVGSRPWQPGWASRWPSECFSGRG